MLKSVGLFFIYMGTVAFTKTYLNPAQHIALLKSRGLPPQVILPSQKHGRWERNTP